MIRPWKKCTREMNFLMYVLKLHYLQSTLSSTVSKWMHKIISFVSVYVTCTYLYICLLPLLSINHSRKLKIFLTLLPTIPGKKRFSLHYWSITYHDIDWVGQNLQQVMFIKCRMRCSKIIIISRIRNSLNR